MTTTAATIDAALLDLTSIQQEKRKRCIASFRYFAVQAWKVIEPSTAFVGGWHIDALCLHLEAVTHGDIKRLLVNMPPRHCKSSLIRVLWPVWCWLQNPSHRFLCASYALSLSIRDNRKCRILIQSDWFQSLFGDLVTLAADQNVKIKFETTKRGYIQAVSVGSSATGEGGDTLLIDDPHSIDDKRSDIKRETVLDWFRDTWSTRLNDRATGAMVVVGQRVHAQDLSGFILEQDQYEHEWTHLNLPAEYEPGSPSQTFIHDVFFWQDPRVKEGELLWEAKFSQNEIEKAKRNHGPIGYAALYQQRPVPAGGSIFQAKNQRYFTFDTATQCYILETPRGPKPVPIADCWNLCTVDLAISEAQSADFFVMTAYAVTPYRDLLKLDVVREHFAFDEQSDQLVLFHQKHHFMLFAIEAVAYQLALVQNAVNRGIPAKPYKPHTDKVVRATTISIWHANGKCYSLKHAHWLPENEKELFTFPKASHDDQVDTDSLAGIVVCSPQAPSVHDMSIPLPVGEMIDDTLSIEQIVDAEAIAEEQKQAAQQQNEQEREAYRQNRVPLDPFAWADMHSEGDVWA